MAPENRADRQRDWRRGIASRADCTPILHGSCRLHSSGGASGTDGALCRDRDGRSYRRDPLRKERAYAAASCVPDQDDDALHRIPGDRGRPFVAGHHGHRHQIRRVAAAVAPRPKAGAEDRPALSCSGCGDQVGQRCGLGHRGPHRRRCGYLRQENDADRPPTGNE